MILLAIETSGKVGSFAVVGDGRPTAGPIGVAAGRMVETGVGVIDRLLGLASVRLDDLDGVAVSLGPGSFTGLRVGLALAKGICFGRGLPLVGVPTLDAIAVELFNHKGYIVPVVDAKRGEIYTSVYLSDESGVARQSDYMALPPQALVDEIRRLGEDREILLAGDALGQYGATLSSGLFSNVKTAGSDAWSAHAGAIGRIGLRLLAEGKVLDLAAAEPLYIRPSEAERKARGKMGSRATGRENKKND